MSGGRVLGWIGVIAGLALGGGSGFAAVVTRTAYDNFLSRVSVEGRWDPTQVKDIEGWRLATNLLLAGAVTSAIAAYAPLGAR